MTVKNVIGISRGQTGAHCPHAHRKVWRVLFRRVDGSRGYQVFPTEVQVAAFVADAQRYLVKDGRPIEEVIDAFVASQTLLRVTLRYRCRAICTGRERMPILNATLRKLGGASNDTVTKALGWTSIEVGKRHSLAPGTIERVEGRRTHGRLLPAQAA